MYVDYNPNAALPDQEEEEQHHKQQEGDPTAVEVLYYHHQPPVGAGLVLPKGEEEAPPPVPGAAAMGLQLDHPPPPHLDFHYTHLGQDLTPAPMMFHHHYDHHHHPSWEDGAATTSYDIPMPPMSEPPAFSGPAQDVMINLLNLPRCSASSFLMDPDQDTPPPSVSSVLYDTVFLPPQQPPFFRELFQSSPLPGAPPPYLPRGLFGEDNHHSGDGVMGCLFQEEPVDPVGQKFEGGVFEFARDMACVVGKGRRGGRKVTKHFTTERERRVNMNGRFDALRSLVPNPSKADRASTVADAIDYIKELLRSVDELKLLVEKKRRRNGRGGRSKRHKTEGDVKEDVESSALKLLPEVDDQDDPSYDNGSVRTSWLQRKSKDSEVDVRVVDDEVTIKLVWRKKINCLLLYVSKALDELQLDLHHVAGGHIGDHCCFLFNTKIYEGSSVYASAIANKLIAVVDGQFAATPPTVGCY